MKTTLFALAIALTAGATTAAARGPRPDKAAFDKNADGVLDDAERAELREWIKARRAARKQEALARWDADKDGKLSDPERARMRHDRAVERFRAIDVNKDGWVSFAEFEAAHSKKTR